MAAEERPSGKSLAGPCDACRGRLNAVHPVIISYTELPDDAGGWPRPLLDIAVADMDDVLVPCLVDSGALNTLLPCWVAEAAGIFRYFTVTFRSVDFEFELDRRTAGIGVPGGHRAVTVP